MMDWLVATFFWLLAFALALPGILWNWVVGYARENPVYAALAGLAILRAFGTTVQSGTAGVLFSFGRARKVLEPGFHPLIPIFQRVRHTPTRSITLDLPRQRVTTRDGLVYDIDSNIVYRTDDPIKAAIEIDHVKRGVATILALLVADLMREQTQESFNERQMLDQQLTTRSRAALARWGLYVEQAGLTTIAPTRPTIRLTQLTARARERQLLLGLCEENGVDLALGTALTTGGRGPLGRSAARYHRHRQPTDRESNHALVVVLMPPDARLLVGELVLTPGEKTIFESPPLEHGKTYTYTLRIQYDGFAFVPEEMLTRRVEVRAGMVSMVDFANG